MRRIKLPFNNTQVLQELNVFHGISFSIGIVKIHCSQTFKKFRVDTHAFLSHNNTALEIELRTLKFCYHLPVREFSSPLLSVAALQDYRTAYAFITES